MDNNINFTAKYICPCKIKKNNYGFYRNFNASFVELKQNDLPVLKNTTCEWNQLFSDEITNQANKKLKSKDSKHHFYALTTQKANFEQLESKKILGLTQYREGKTLDEIELLQINPKFINKEKTLAEKIRNFVLKKQLEYKGCGKGILNSLKKIYKNKDIEIQSATASTGFYERMGCTPVYKDGTIYIIKQTKKLA